MTTAATRRRPARALVRPRPVLALRRVPPLPVLLVGGWALLLVAWALANPPFLAPDEPAHYLRAVAVGEGKLAGDAVVDVPPRLWAEWRDPGGTTCNMGKPARSAACVADTVPVAETTPVATGAGAYPPLYYLLPGVVLRAADDPFAATRLARLAAALTSLAFLALAAALLASRESLRVSLLGLVVTVTPMVLFVSASVNSSGLEIAAGIAFFAALLRLARGEPEQWVWWAAAAAGFALVLSRATGVFWLALDLLVFLALAGPRGATRTLRSAPRAAAAVGALLVVAGVANRAWEEAYGNPITQEGSASPVGGESDAGGAGSVRFWLWHGVQQLERIFDEQVGVFGWLDTLMPNVAYPGWQALVAGLLVLALVAGSRGERWLLLAAIGLSLAVPVLLSATLIAATGMDVQGRHVLPFAVVVPLLAGEILFRNRARLALLDTGFLFVAVAVVAAGIHVLGFYANAYRQSVGTEGPRFFVSHADWSPPLGWTPWLLLALAGGALVALSATGAAVARRRAG